MKSKKLSFGQRRKFQAQQGILNFGAIRHQRLRSLGNTAESERLFLKRKGWRRRKNWSSSTRSFRRWRRHAFAFYTDNAGRVVAWIPAGSLTAWISST